jgi:hypothetical protein
VPRCAQRRGDAAKCSSANTIERNDVKVRLGDEPVEYPVRAEPNFNTDERTFIELDEGHAWWP